MRREREATTRPCGVAMSRFAAASIIDYYESRPTGPTSSCRAPTSTRRPMPAGRSRAAASTAQRRSAAAAPVRGQGLRRKGSTGCSALQIARDRGLAAELRVIGCDPRACRATARAQGVSGAVSFPRGGGERLFRLMASATWAACCRGRSSAHRAAEYLALGLVVIGPTLGLRASCWRTPPSRSLRPHRMKRSPTPCSA